MKKIHTNSNSLFCYQKLNILFLFFLLTHTFVLGQIENVYLNDASPFFKAVRKDNLEELEKLTKENPDGLSKKFFYKNLFFFAKSKKMIDFLSKNGVDINHLDENNTIALHHAQSLEVAKALVENGANIEIYSHSYQKETPILSLCMSKEANKIIDYLIDKGANVFAVNAQDEGLMHKIAQTREPIEQALIDKLIKIGLSLETKNRSNQTPIFEAIGQGNINKVELFLKNKAKLPTDNPQGYNSLTYNNSGIDIFKMLINYNKFDFNVKTEDGDLFWLFLLMSDYQGNNNMLEGVDLMIEKGLGVKVKNKDGKTPLFLALSRKILPIKTINLLLDKKADVKGVDKNDSNLLILALKNPDVPLALVKRLVEKGVDINASNKLGMTPFSLSLSQNNTEITDYLIQKKVDINLKNNQNKTALHYVKSPKMAEYFLKKGFDINAKNKEGNTPLMLALLDNNKPLIKFLIENNADVNSQNSMGNVPLHLVTDVEIATLLLDKKANINTKNTQGNTPLHFADNVQISKLFVEKGADVNATNNDRNTPLLMALIEQQPEIAQFLIEKGAKNTENNFGMSASKLAKEINQEHLYFMLQGDKIYNTYLKTLKLWEGIYANNINEVKDAINKGADTTLLNSKEKNMARMLKDNYYKNYNDFLAGKNTYNTLIQQQRLYYPNQVQFLKNTNFIIVKGYGSFHLIDIKTSRIIKEFLSYLPTFGNITISEDKKYLLTSDKKWDINSGKIVRNYQEIVSEFEEDLTQEPEFDVISLDKRYAINNETGEQSGNLEIEIFDYQNRKKLFEIKKEGYLQQVYFSNQNNYLITKFSTGISVWDLKKQKEIFSLLNQDVSLIEIAMSKNEKYIATNELENSSQFIKVYDVATQKLLKNINGINPTNETILHLSFVKNDEWLMVAHKDTLINILDWQSNKKIASFRNEMLFGNLLLCVSDDGQQIFISQNENSFKLYDIKSEKLLSTFSSLKGDIQKFSYSNDLEYFVKSEYIKNETILQNIANGKNIIIPSKTGQEYTSLKPVFSPNLQEVLLFPKPDVAELWNIEKIKKVKTYPNMISNFENKVHFSETGKYILVVKMNAEVVLWDVNKDEPIANLDTYATYKASVSEVTMNDDAKTILIGLHLNEQNKHQVIIWKPLEKSDENIKLITENIVGIVNNFAISKQEKYLCITASYLTEAATKGDDQEPVTALQIWDFKKEKLLHTLPTKDPILKVFFTNDEKILITVFSNSSGAYANSITLWNTSSGQEIKTIRINESIEDVSFIALKKQMVVKTQNYLKVIDIDTEKDILNVYENAIEKSLFFVTNEGFYMPVNYDIENEEQKVTYFVHQNKKQAKTPFQFVNGTTVFMNEQFELQFNQPHKILEKLVEKNQTIINSYKMIYEENLQNNGFKLADLEKERFFNTPEIKLKNINSIFQTTKEKNYSLEIEALDKVYNLHSLHILVNDKPIFSQKGKKLTTKKINEIVKLNLEKGKNIVKIWVYNQKGIKSLEEYLEIELL